MHEDKQLIVFDLDKTLAKSKQPMDDEMAGLICRLLECKGVAVISGGSFDQFQKQFVSKLTGGNLSRLSLFPTCGAAFYRYEDEAWKNIYTEVLNAEEKARIFKAFEAMFGEVNFRKPDVLYGDLVEDRETQITFSAFGSHAPLVIKETWDPNRAKRLRMINILSRLLPDFEVRVGGTTSIDVTRKGIDKAYGILQMEKYLSVPRKNMLFIGDDLGEGGNDFPVIGTGVHVVAVKDPEDTKQLIRKIVQ
jgi:HAD superfamily hydrolase (TIGR01484 family)